MKKEKYYSDINRIKNVIENDRLSFSSQSMPLILADLKDVINNYFNLIDEPSIEIIKENNIYKVVITCNASAIKSFAVIP